MENFWTIAANQGFAVFLLAIAVYYFYQRQKQWEAKIEALHEKRNVEREQLIQLTEELKMVIKQNTETLEAIKGLINNGLVHDRDKVRR